MQQDNRPTRAVVWRHYSRKTYAMFQSIGREFTIGVLGVAMLSTQQVTASNALGTSTHRPTNDEQVADSTSLDEVMVTGTMAPLAAMQQARIVSVITREDINRAAAPTVNDLLKQVAGVDVRQRGGFSIQTDISIDGGTFDQVTILLNGINITNPQTGHHTMDLPVNPHDIERIEILEGAASRVYGGAFGGAINIITNNTPPLPSPQGEGALSSPSTGDKGKASPHKSINKAPSLVGKAGVGFGSWGTLGGEASVSAATRHTTHMLTGGAQRSDGGTPNSDFHRTNLFYQGTWQIQPPPQPSPTGEGVSSSLSTDDKDKASSHKSIDRTPSLEGRAGVGLYWQFGLSQKQYGANTFYSPKYPNQWEGNRRYMASLSADIDAAVHVRPTVYWNRAYDHFQLIRGTSTGENHHRTDVIGGGITADKRWLLGKTAIGTAIRHERIASTNLGRPKQASAPAPIADKGHPHQAPSVHDVSDVGLYTHADHRTQYDINIEHNVLLERWTISAGMLTSMNTAVDSRWRLYPGVDISFRPDAHWRIYASYNKGFRMPTFTDLYYSGAERQGNGSLLPEETHSLSLGAVHRTSWCTTTARIFYHRGRHMIDWVKHAATDPVYYAADFELDNVGAQIKADFNLNRILNSQFSILNFGLSYTYIHQHRYDAQPVYKSSYAGEYLRHKFTASLAHPIIGPLMMQWNLRVCDRVGSYELYEDAQPTGTLHPYRPYAVLDAKINCPLPHFTLWLSGENITNHRYYDLGNIPQPALCLTAGIRWTL